MAFIPRTLLIFDLDGARFGLDATQVRESVWLPELTPVEEAPHYIVGIFSLRGQIVPVTDLNMRFSHPARPYRLSDQIVILEQDQLLMGLIVSEVREVIECAPDVIQPSPKFDVAAPVHACLIEGEVRVGDDIVLLLNMGELMHLPQDLNCVDTAQTFPSQHFCPEAMPEEHAEYRARAKALMELASEEEDNCLPLAVVELGGEYFGIELDAVQEFIGISSTCPIPCSPPHILGAISLRGNLLTLLDLRGALNLPHTSNNWGKAIIAFLGEQMVGVAVDEVHDVVYLRKEVLQAPPATLREKLGAQIKGTAPYADRMMIVLDLPALLAREEWIVNETV